MKKTILLEIVIFSLLFFGASVAFGEEPESEPIHITTGSFLTIRIDEQLKDRDIFPIDREDRNNIKYGLHIGTYEQCLPDIDNQHPKDRELGTVIRSQELHYDLKFALDGARLERLRFDADRVKVQIVYTVPDGGEEIWEREIPFPYTDFYLRGSGAEIPYQGENFVTRDSLEVVYYGFFPTENEQMQLRFYLLSDKVDIGKCYTAGEIVENKVNFSGRCEDHIIGHGSHRANNYFEANFSASEFPENMRVKEANFLLINPRITGKFKKADGSSAERAVQFGNDLLITFYAEYDSTNNRCLKYEIEYR